MSGKARRTCKTEAARQIAEFVGIAPPSSTGGTIPAAWLPALMTWHNLPPSPLSRWR